MSLQKQMNNMTDLEKTQLQDIINEYKDTNKSALFLEWYGHFIQKGNTPLTAGELAKAEMDKL